METDVVIIVLITVISVFIVGIMLYIAVEKMQLISRWKKSRYAGMNTLQSSESVTALNQLQQQSAQGSALTTLQMTASTQRNTYQTTSASEKHLNTTTSSFQHTQTHNSKETTNTTNISSEPGGMISPAVTGRNSSVSIPANMTGIKKTSATAHDNDTFNDTSYSNNPDVSQAAADRIPESQKTQISLADEQHVKTGLSTIYSATELSSTALSNQNNNSNNNTSNSNTQSKTITSNSNNDTTEQKYQNNQPRPSVMSFRDRFFSSVWSQSRPSAVSNHSASTLKTFGPTLSIPGFLMASMNVDYEIGSVLTEGGGGMIFIGKLISSQLISRNGGASSCVLKVMKDMRNFGIEDSSANFFHEVAVTWLFNTSKNFVKLIAYSNEPKIMVMKNYDYGTLKQAIYSSGDKFYLEDNKKTCNIIVNLMYDIACALAEMHHIGVVHNDLKPSNILLDKDESGYIAVLCDFGVASVVDQSLFKVISMPKSIVNGASVRYAGPEVFLRLQKLADDGSTLSMLSPVRGDGAEVIKASDIYAFAIIMYEMLARNEPWGDDSFEKIEHAVKAGKRPNIPDSLKEWARDDSKVGELMTLMNVCWSQLPQKRSQAKKILLQIYKLKRSH